MNILDLNEDIMSKVKHNIFLKNLIKHKEDKFNYNYIDWECWELGTDLAGYYATGRNDLTNYCMPFLDRDGNCWRHACIRNVYKV
eukprot:SAG11_NODE_127_length_15677_cov_10.890872_14_plen_85_part_00